MTLSNVFSSSKTQKILDVMPDVTSVWKVVLMNPRERCYTAPYVGSKYRGGKMEAVIYDSRSRDGSNYDLFYHFWVKKVFVLERLNIWLEARAKILEGLDKTINPNIRIMKDPRGLYNFPVFSPEPYEGLYTVPRVINCVIHKDWITTIGTQEGGLSVICKYAIFPEYPDISPDPKLHFVVDDIDEISTVEPQTTISAMRIGNPEPMELCVSCKNG